MFNLKERYVHDLLKRLVTRVKWVIALTIPLILVLGGLDYLVYPDLFLIFSGLRMLWIMIFAVAFLLSYHPSVQRRILWLSDLLIIVSGAMISLMIYFADGIESQYFGGILLLSFGAYFANPVFPLHHLFSGLLVICAYNLALYFNDPLVSVWDLAASNYFIICSYVGVMGMCYLYKKHDFKRFAAERRLKATKKRLYETNKKLAKMYEKVERESQIDSLTRAVNRKHFYKILERRIRQIKGTDACFFVAMIDLDSFKEINDVCGHVIGDKALQATVKGIKAIIGDDGVVGRYGGDEFSLILDVRDGELCELRIQEIIRMVATIGRLELGASVRLSVSIGITGVLGLEGGLTAETIVERADQSLLRCKKSAKGSYKFYTNLLPESVQDHEDDYPVIDNKK